MTRTICLLLVASLSMATTTRSEARVCQYAEHSFPYVNVEEDGKLWTYSASIAGPDWQHVAYGYHATGLVGCDSCSSFGLYYLGNGRSLPAEERAKRRLEAFGYPTLMLGPTELEHRASRGELVVGPLTGYAIRYDVRIPRPKEANANNVEQWGLLVVSLTDGCVTFDVTLRTPAAEGENQWALLDALLRELTIERELAKDQTRTGLQWNPQWRSKFREQNERSPSGQKAFPKAEPGSSSSDRANP